MQHNSETKVMLRWVSRHNSEPHVSGWFSFSVHIKSNRFLFLLIKLCNVVGKSRDAKSIQNIIAPIIILYLPFRICLIIRWAALSSRIPFFFKNRASFSRFMLLMWLLFFTSNVSSGGGITKQTFTLESASSVFKELENPITALFEEP